MTLEEQEHIKREGYKEAMRYIANAKDYLQKSPVDESGWCTDKKYVRTACGAAYNGVLEALGTYFSLKNPDMLKSKEPKTIDFYRKHLAKENRKMLKELNYAYTILHIMGYYDGVVNSNVVKEGFRKAQQIIDLIKPAGATR